MIECLPILYSKISPSFKSDSLIEVSSQELQEIKQDFLSYGSKFANVCYSEKQFLEIFNEPNQSTLSRMERTLNSGHHSVYEHTYLTFELSNIPKSLVMILNNQNVYVTSEKSARYTQMNQVSSLEKKLYNKWIDIFISTIKSEYDFLDENRVKKLSQENARYMTSVHTPTKLIHTLSFRQLNYLMNFFENFIENADSNPYNNSLKKSMNDFINIDLFKKIRVPKLNPISRNELNWFSKFNVEEYFDSTYSVNYNMSFASLAQAQRHRTITYQVENFNSINDFFVPLILNESQRNEWINDLKRVSDLFPQAGLLKVNERGIFEHFAMKATERLCGFAQLETMKNTKQTLEKYLSLANNLEIKKYLEENAKSKCLKNRCASSCEFGPKLGLTRLI